MLVHNLVIMTDLMLWTLKTLVLTTSISLSDVPKLLLSWNVSWTALHIYLVISFGGILLDFLHTLSKWCCAHILNNSSQMLGTCMAHMLYHNSCTFAGSFFCELIFLTTYLPCPPISNSLFSFILSNMAFWAVCTSSCPVKLSTCSVVASCLFYHG